VKVRCDLCGTVLAVSGEPTPGPAPRIHCKCGNVMERPTPAPTPPPDRPPLASAPRVESLAPLMPPVEWDRPWDPAGPRPPDLVPAPSAADGGGTSAVDRAEVAAAVYLRAEEVGGLLTPLETLGPRPPPPAPAPLPAPLPASAARRPRARSPAPVPAGPALGRLQLAHVTPGAGVAVQAGVAGVAALPPAALAAALPPRAEDEDEDAVVALALDPLRAAARRRRLLLAAAVALALAAIAAIAVALRAR
jgi:hypothetical protein